MDIVIFYIFSLIYLNNNINSVLNNTGLVKDKDIMYSAEKLVDYIENTENLTVVSSRKIRKILKENHVYSYQTLPFLHLLNDDKLSDDIKIFISLNKKNYNKIGFYKGERYLAVILVNELLKTRIEPKKDIYKRYEYINIHGADIKKGVKLFSLYINPPSNKIKKILLPVINNRFSFKYKLRESGKYIFEIITEKNNDPKIVSKLIINTGKNQNSLNCNNEIKNKDDLLKDINRIRITNGLKKVEELYSLSEVAFLHSKDMAENNFFSHISGNGLTPYQRVKNSGIKFKKISENISQAPELCLAHNEILESPGHLKNLLDNGVNRIGLGIYQKNDLFYLTEDFIFLNTQKTLKEYKRIFYKSMLYFNIHNNTFLNRIAKRKNYNEYYMIKRIPKKLPIYISRFRSIKSYFFILNDITPELLKEIKNITAFNYFGYNISKFKIKNKSYLFLTVILANL